MNVESSDNKNQKYIVHFEKQFILLLMNELLVSDRRGFINV